MSNKPIIGIIGKVQPKYDEDLWHRIDGDVRSSVYQLYQCEFRI